MQTVGEYITPDLRCNVVVEWQADYTEVGLIVGGNIVSAYKQTKDNKQMCYGSVKSKEVYKLLITGWRGCKASNGVPAPFALGTVVRHTFANRAKVKFTVDKYNNLLAGAEIMDEKGTSLYLAYQPGASIIPPNIPYIGLTVEQELGGGVKPEDAIQVRTLAEIALEKDITWLNGRKYFVVNETADGEALFNALENFNGVIAYDTETTGLKINMFGKVNSKWEKQLAEYNADKPEGEHIKADKLVGIIFCAEPGVSYYIPCANRKFHNLYEDKSDPVVQRLSENIKAQYTVGAGHNMQDDMARYFRNTPISEYRTDTLVMERCRKILETKNLVGHHIAFDWKVGWMYNINTHFTDDTMLLHQLMYKFRSTTSNRGEPSDLKSLTKREFNIEQLSLTDFFIGFKEDDRAEVRGSAGKKKKTSKSKKNLYIDFSYMTYDGARAYGPADGDFTLSLYLPYKRDLVYSHRDLQYLYSVEVIVAMAIGYMEFYGHRIDESKIEATRKKYEEDKAKIEEQIRALANLAPDQELSLTAPAQVAYLFYDIMGIPFEGEKRSVSKAAIKPLMSLKNEDGSLKYPIVTLYSDWKKIDTLLTKFFDNLQNFMYPGGYIFSSYGQISTATGRMSCIEENAQISVVGGNKPIREVQPGDRVYCYDQNGNIKTSRVLQVIDNGYRECVEMKFDRPDGRWLNLTCTPEHRLRLPDNIWFEARELSPGAMVCSLTDTGAGSVAMAKRKPAGVHHVYDLEVEDYHNFIANGVCVHNCSKPNAQQYPKAVTKIVVPRENYIMIDADYSQIEYRTLVALAHEENLMKTFEDPDSDYHTLMASRMYGVPYASVTPAMRSDAKAFNFGIPYGMGFKSLAIRLTGMSGEEQIEEAKQKYELYFKDQPKVRKFFSDVKEAALINKFTQTYFGRRRYYSFVGKDGKEDNRRKGAALRQAGNAVIQGTAADIYKISVARMFTWICQNNLMGDVLITNMIHDEQLLEVNCDKLNIQAILRDVLAKMQFKVEGFPPLYVGGGVGVSWAEAKDKMAEIHPLLGDEFSQEAQGLSIYSNGPVPKKEWLDYFNKRIYAFRKDRIKDYLMDSSNYGQDLDPAVGNMLNLQFVPAEIKEILKENPQYYKGKENQETEDILAAFIRDNGLDVDPRVFNSKFQAGGFVQEEDDVEYEDEDEPEDGDDLDLLEGEFALIDEDDTLYGVSMQELIKTFGLVLSKERQVCGIDIEIVPLYKREALFEYLEQHACDPEDEGAMRVTFLRPGNVLFKADVWVKDINGSAMSAKLQLNALV